MSDEQFDVVFFGILQPGKDKDTAMQNMAKLFKTDARKLAPYFAGGRKVIKGKINAAAAEKYRAALENVGLVIKIEVCEIAEDPTAADASSSIPDTGDMSIAAAGSDIIENPITPPVQKIDDFSALTMADAGVDVIENPVEKKAQKIDDISDITVAEAGVDVIKNPVAIPAQKIEELSGVTIAEAGSNMIENPEPIKKATDVDISELSLED